jgi:uncharacterized membrane protein YfcA
MVLLLGFSQREAQATSLAMILSPFAAPGIWNYHRGGLIEWRIVFFMAPSMLVGSYIGSEVGKALPQSLMKLIFAIVLAYIAAYMVFSKLDMVKGFSLALIPVAVMLLVAWPAGVFKVVATKSAAETETSTPADVQESNHATPLTDAPDGVRVE